ncbi:amidohydrolase family protein [Hyphomonas sp.]|uniref:amidohydrolase family protein n=1 Tax=Hyphomonas sp. TaxID=87 RepID=UPI0032EBE323
MDPDLPICDAHHHLWDVPGHQYQLDEFNADATIGQDASDRHNVVSTIFVECTTSYTEGTDAYQRYVGETAFIDGLAETCLKRDDISIEIAKAIIARADVDDHETLTAAIDVHTKASPKRFRGFRHAVNWDADPEIGKAHTDPKPGLLLDPDFQRGAAILAEHDVIFETVILHTQIEELTKFAKRVPKLKIVLGHMGSIVGVGRFEGQEDAVFADWSRQISKLSECDNVHVKLGGINMMRHGFGWHKRPLPPTSDELVDRTGRYYLHTINCFGPQRCMFESNFPMDKISCSYHVLWNAFKKMTASMSNSDRSLLFQETAERLYNIAPDS